VPSQRFRVEPRALRDDEIAEIVAGYARGAEFAAAGALDGVEISAAHGYLIEQFLRPELNLRRDGWRDGERFLRDVIGAVAAAGLAVGVRLSADSEAARRIAPVLAELHVDYVSVALGDSSTYRGSTGIVPPPPVRENAIAEQTAPFAVGRPLIATSRVVDPAEADRLIGTGRADALGMTRALITDPELPRKAREGRLDEILRCIACNACIAHYHAGTPIRCAQNPRTGRERSLPTTRRPAPGRRVLVVGAGPAGLAAAVESAAIGAKVLLLERTDRIGGQIALAGVAPGHAEVARRLCENYERMLAAAGVELRVGTSAAREDVEALEPDAVVVATGARPYEPVLDLNGIRTAQAWEVLAGPTPTDRRVVVADWGGDPAGLACAEVLRAEGNEVTLAVASVAVGEAVHQYQRNLYLERLYRSGVRIQQHLELVGAHEGRAVFRNTFAHELEEALDADLLVLALGRVPEDALAAELAARGLGIGEAGDCRSPRSLEEAVLEGTLAARRLVAAQSDRVATA
jgi:NADPH-dependent 2,4-dienoyl-CoA reductase/sulfur reductase-like enzyme